MKDTAEAYLGKTVKNAVVTVPAYFNDSQRAATIDAARIAGLNVLRIINEPTAAAIAYGLEKKESKERNVLIFDLGGGTFDVSILTIQNDVFEVISTAGDTHLGGEDFDNRMVNYFADEFKRKYNKDLFSNKKALRRLRTACERAKRTLSSATVAEIEIETLQDDIDFCSSISRARFEELNSDFFRNAMVLVEKAIQDAEMDKTRIDHVVLVGGSSRIPKIQKMLRDFFGGKELNKTINPDEAVAYGAAIQAAILNGDKSNIVQDIVLFDVTPLSLGIAVNDGIMNVVIKHNTTIPARATGGYQTKGDNQARALFEVYEGEFEKCEDNYFLGKFLLNGLPPGPAGEAKMDATFEIDANGILTVSAVELSTGIRNQITIAYNKGRLSKDEVDRMIAEAEQYRIIDKKRKAVLAAKDSLESYCIDVMNVVDNKKLNDEIDKVDKDMILKKCEETIAWLNSIQSIEKEAKQLLEEKLEELQIVFDAIIWIARYPNKKIDKYCEILNVSKNSSIDEIRQAYRELGSIYHPDRYEGDKDIAHMYWITICKAKQALVNNYSAKRMKFH